MARGFVAVASLMGVSLLLTGCPKPKENKKTYAKQIKEAMANPDLIARTRALTEIGYNQATKGRDMLGSEETLALASKACAEIPDPSDRVNGFCYLAEAQAGLKRSSSAKEALEKAIAAMEKVEEGPGKARTWARVGRTQGRCGETGGAVKSIKTAEELATPLEDVYERIIILAEIAGSYGTIKKSDEMQRVVDSAMQMATTLESQRKQCEVITKIAVELHKRENDEQAKKTFDTAVAAAKKIEKPYSRCYALMEVATELHKAGQKDQAATILKETELIVPKIKDGTFRQETREKLNVLMDKLRISTKK